MIKTGQQIEDDIYCLLAESPLARSISGAVYKFGTRPKNPVAEDAIVKFVAGLDGQIQDGVVVVNIYVPDTTLEDETNVRDITRCAEIESFGLAWSNDLTTGEYLITRASTIQTYEEADIKQHFVSIRLNFKRITY